MSFFDLPLNELEKYLPERNEPKDFDLFWQNTISSSANYPLDLEITPVDYGLKLIEVFDVTYSGYQGQRIKAWLVQPKNAAGNLPCIVEYIGYGGGRSFPYDWLVWANCGYAHLVMDTRGQGSSWSHGDTPDIEDIPGNPQFPGFMTRGILSPETYFYRRVFTDAVRAVEAARNLPNIDSDKIAVTGGSQGGGITLAAAGLVPDVAIAMPNVPFLCHYKRATEITDAAPYSEIVNFCKAHRNRIDQVFETLSYFDGVNFAVRAKAKALFSVALMDDICPPSTVFAAYNHYAGEKDIHIWPYNHHEGGETFQLKEQVEFVNAMWAS